MSSVNSLIALVVGFAILALMVWVMQTTEESHNIYHPQSQAAAEAPARLAA